MLRITSLLLSITLASPLFAQATKKELTPGQKARAAMVQIAEATPASALNVAPGFKVELLYMVPRSDQGSWVALTTDSKGRIIASDQYGGLYRLTLPPIGTSTGTWIERLDVDFTSVIKDSLPTAGAEAKKKSGPAERVTDGAHGLLYAFDSL
jgi:hypothetical protein